MMHLPRRSLILASGLALTIGGYTNAQTPFSYYKLQPGDSITSESAVVSKTYRAGAPVYQSNFDVSRLREGYKHVQSGGVGEISLVGYSERAGVLESDFTSSYLQTTFTLYRAGGTSESVVRIGRASSNR